MTYIENIFICMVSPLLVAALCMGRRQLRFFLFCIAGMGVCLLSAYINTFLAAVRHSTSPTPCRCCWWRREDCPFSAYRGGNNRIFTP